MAPAKGAAEQKDGMAGKPAGAAAEAADLVDDEDTVVLSAPQKGKGSSKPAEPIMTADDLDDEEDEAGGVKPMLAQQGPKATKKKPIPSTAAVSRDDEEEEDEVPTAVTARKIKAIFYQVPQHGHHTQREMCMTAAC